MYRGRLITITAALSVYFAPSSAQNGEAGRIAINTHQSSEGKSNSGRFRRASKSRLHLPLSNNAANQNIIPGGRPGRQLSPRRGYARGRSFHVSDPRVGPIWTLRGLRLNLTNCSSGTPGPGIRLFSDSEAQRTGVAYEHAQRPPRMAHQTSSLPSVPGSPAY